MRTYDTAASRWAGVGPYYAMFPVDFADTVIKDYTQPGDCVLDPFAGRGTALFSAAAQGRFGLGVEINPVGWVYGRAKLQTAEREEVEERVRWLGRMAPRYRIQASSLPEFFQWCFCQPVREFLVAARSLLHWRYRRVDWTAMALLLVDLHGKRQSAFSNQMRQTKAMSPQYAIRWWQRRDLRPPERNPVDLMLKKIAWRYAKGHLTADGNRLYLGDSRVLLGRLGNRGKRNRPKPAKLLLTSPPYYGITNYFYDQWLRLWLLGGPPQPRSPREDCKRKFENKEHYVEMLRAILNKSKRLLAPGAVIYIRTDARRFTFESTLRVLEEIFPEKKIHQKRHTLPSFTQTSLFDNEVESAGEVDLVLW